MTTRAHDETTSYTDDDWRAGNLAGRCDGSMVGFCGVPEKIVNMLHANMGTWACENGGRVYFSDEGQVWIESIDLGMQDPSSPSTHSLFYKQDPNGILYLPNTCLSHSEIQYYYDQARNLYNTCQNYFYPNHFPNHHVVTDCYIQYKEGTWGIKKNAWWKIYLWHAKLNCSGTQPNID